MPMFISLAPVHVLRCSLGVYPIALHTAFRNVHEVPMFISLAPVDVLRCSLGVYPIDLQTAIRRGHIVFTECPCSFPSPLSTFCVVHWVCIPSIPRP